jgi:hypothetical protein
MLIDKGTETVSDSTTTDNVVDPPAGEATFVAPNNSAELEASRIAAEKMARFNAAAAKRDQEAKEKLIKEQISALPLSQRDKFLTDLEINNRLSKLNLNRENIRQRKIQKAEDLRLETERLIQNGLRYQEQLAADRIAAAEAKRLQREAEASAYEALRRAEQAKNDVNVLASEADRLADEAARQVTAAKSRINDIKEKSKKSVNPSNWKI